MSEIRGSVFSLRCDGGCGGIYKGPRCCARVEIARNGARADGWTTEGVDLCGFCGDAKRRLEAKGAE